MISVGGEGWEGLDATVNVFFIDFSDSRGTEFVADIWTSTKLPVARPDLVHTSYVISTISSLMKEPSYSGS